MDNNRMIELINAFMDYLSVANDAHETIRTLMDIGFTSDELVDEFRWSLSDVREVEESFE